MLNYTRVVNHGSYFEIHPERRPFLFEVTIDNQELRILSFDNDEITFDLSNRVIFREETTYTDNELNKDTTVTLSIDELLEDVEVREAIKKKLKEME